MEYVIVIVHYIHQNLWQYTSEDEGEDPRPRMVYAAINSYVVDNKCYIPTGMTKLMLAT